MLEIVFSVAGNAAVDSTGAEQENGLLEQRGTYLGHHEYSAGGVEKRNHAERRHDDLVSGHRRWRRRCRPGKRGTLNACLRNEGPEHYQCPVSWCVVRGDHRAVSKEPCKIEVSMRDTLDPIANTLS